MGQSACSFVCPGQTEKSEIQNCRCKKKKKKSLAKPGKDREANT